MPQTEILMFIASIAICLTGGVALATYILRFRSKERDLLWIGLRQAPMHFAMAFKKKSSSGPARPRADRRMTSRW